MGKKIDGGTVVVDGKGNMKQLNKELNKTSKGFNTLDKNAQSADRGMKGASNMSSNATKNFSKLSQGISGGLVPAYATLAANLFAIDAVFRFLKDAADFRVLKEGQVAFAAATGVAYQSLARDLQAATNNMISFRDAAQAGAIGRAAGLSAGQLTELSDAAFKVSVALGRDVTDSFNRLVRGVTKAEPELLDELGIVLRLEEATTKYAAALGLNKNQLSIYQKSQAVVNEVLDQTERKFGRIDAIMNPQANALAQLGVAFEEVVDQIKAFIAPFAEGIGKFATENIEVITVAILGFGAGIINSVIPSVAALQEAQTAQTVAHRAELERLDNKYQQLQARKQALASTPISQQNFMAETGAMGIDIGGSAGETLKAGGTLTPQQRGNLRSQLNRKGGPIGAFKGATKAQQKSLNKLFDSMKKDAGGQSMKGAQLRLEEFFLTGQIGANKAAGGFKSFTNVVSKGARKIMMAFSGLMTAVAIFSVAFTAFKAVMSFFNKEKEARLNAYNKRLREVSKSQERFNVELNKMAEVAEKGLITTLSDQIEHTGEAVASANLTQMMNNFQLMAADAELNKEEFGKFATEVDFTLKRLGELDSRFEDVREEFRRTGQFTEDLRGRIEELNAELLENNMAVKAIRESEGELIKANNRLVQSLPKVEFQDIIELLMVQNREFERLIKNNKNFTVEQEKVNAQLELFNVLQQKSIDIENRKQKAARMSLGDSIFSVRGIKNYVAQEQKRVQISTTLQDINKAIVTLNTADVLQNENKARAIKQQLDAKVELLKLQKMELDFLNLQQDRGFQLTDALYKGLEKDLGQAISGALRGQDNAFEALGKNFTKTITDSIGNMLAEQFMEDTFKDLLGVEDVKDKIFLGAEYHALLIQKAIQDGGSAHATELGKAIIDKGATGTGFGSHAGGVDKVMSFQNDQLQEKIIALQKAEKSSLEKQKEEIDTEIDNIETKMKNREYLLSEGGIREKYGSGESRERNRDVTQFMLDNLGPQGAAEAQKALSQAERDRALAQKIQGFIEARERGEDVDVGLLNYAMPDKFRLGQFGGKVHGGHKYHGQNMTELERLQAFILDRSAKSYSQFGGIMSGKRSTFEGGFDPTGAFMEVAGAGGGRYMPSSDKEHFLNTRLSNEFIKDFFALNPKDMDEFSEKFVLDLINGIEQAKIDQLQDSSRVLNLETEGTGINRLIAGIDAKLATLSLSGKSGSGMESGAGGEVEVNKGILLPNGAINPEFLNTFNGTFEELLQAYRDAKVKAEDENETGMDKFSKNLNQFSGVIGMMGALTGEEEKTAKIMAKVAKIQLMITMYERAKMALGTEGNIFDKLGAFMFGESGARQGGIMSQHGRSYSQGGIADGPNSGYTAMLHGREAVIPLPNGRSIPVDIGKGKMNTNNTNITVNIDDAGATSKVDGEGGKELGVAIQGVVQAELERQMRPGGLLGT
jgi:hypothetical protein